jgi:hypothetical protein
MFTGSLRTAATLLAAVAISLAGASSAGATVGPAGNGEPPTTKSTTNTWHFAYIPVSTGYQMCFELYKGNTKIKTFANYPTGGHPPAGSNGMCTGIMYTSQQGTIPFTESGLEPGQQYTVCSMSFENYGYGNPWFMRVNSYQSCSSTTIDTGKPTATTVGRRRGAVHAQPDHPGRHRLPGRAQPPVVAEPRLGHREGRHDRLPDP